MKLDSLWGCTGRSPSIVLCDFPQYTGPTFIPGQPHTVPIVAIQRYYVATTTHIRTGLPLTLAWALTIHKSQGLTLPKAVIDIGPAEMSVGMSFVALSRARCLIDILLTPFVFTRLSKLSENNQMVQRRNEEIRLGALSAREH
jgi:hypothetical protein